MHVTAAITAVVAVAGRVAGRVRVRKGLALSVSPAAGGERRGGRGARPWDPGPHRDTGLPAQEVRGM